MVTCIIGPPVTGDDLYGRDEEMKAIWRTAKHSSISLIGPRRFGKTSLTHQMRDYPEDGVVVYFLDVEDTQNPIDFVKKLAQSARKTRRFQDKVKKGLSDAKDTFEEVEFEGIRIKFKPNDTDWQKIGNQVFLRINEIKQNAIFILDELPAMLENIMEGEKGPKGARAFLQWFRATRMELGIKFVICGSIGIRHILKKCNAEEFLNDVEEITVGPLTVELGRGMITELLDGERIKHLPEHTEKILNLLGTPVPFFINIFFREIESRVSKAGFVLTDDIISDAYCNGVIGNSGNGKKYLKYYHDSLKKRFERNEKEIVFRILDHIAQKGSSNAKHLYNVYTTHAQAGTLAAFNEIIERLCDEFIIVQEKQAYVFSTKVLQDLWLNRKALVR